LQGCRGAKEFTALFRQFLCGGFQGLIDRLHLQNAGLTGAEFIACLVETLRQGQGFLIQAFVPIPTTGRQIVYFDLQFLLENFTADSG
jgi:hypothetical protein